MPGIPVGFGTAPARLRAMCVMLVLSAGAAAGAAPVRWGFAAGTDGWHAAHGCELSAAGGTLRVRSLGADPYMHGPPVRVTGPVEVRFRARFANSGQARLYWTTLQPSLTSTPWTDAAAIYFNVVHDHAWREYAFSLDTDRTVTQIRIDPGKGPGTAEFDWIELRPLTVAAVEVSGASKGAPLTVSAGPVRLSFSPASRTFTIRDAITGRTWRSERPVGARIVRAQRTGPDRLQLHLRSLDTGADAACAVRVRAEGRVDFTVSPKDPGASMVHFRFPPPIRTAVANGALVFTNRSCGQLVPQSATDYPMLQLGSYANLGLDMPWLGVIDRNRGDGLMLLLHTPVDADVMLAPDGAGKLWPHVRWTSVKGRWGYGRTASYRFLRSGGYAGLARMYRAYADATGLARTLGEKARARPTVARLRGAPTMWGIEQTDTALGPPVEVARQIRAFGVRRAILNLGSTVPDAAVPAINALGFLTGEYDNYDDVAEGPVGLTTGPVEQHALRLADGSRALGWLHEDGRQMFRRSSAVALGVAREIVPAKQARRPLNARFIDVSSTVDLMEDYHPTRGYDRRGDLRNRVGLYRYIGALGLVVGGEHAKAWTLPVVDYAEGKLSGPFWWEMPAVYLKVPTSRNAMLPNYRKWGINPAVRIPLWELAFHDCMVSTWYWADGNGYYTAVAPEMDDFQDLTTMLYGGIPLFWLNHLSYGWNRNRSRLLESYWVTCKLHEVVGFDRMTDHRFLTPDGLVQRTTFSSGATVTVNYGERPFKLPGRTAVTLAPRGFAAHARGVRQSRTMAGGAAVTVVHGDGYRFVRTDAAASVGPVTVNGRVAAWRTGPRAWRVAADCRGACRIDLERLTTLRGTAAITRLHDNGTPAGPAARVQGIAEFGAAEGLRLYDVHWKPTAESASRKRP